MIKKYCKKPIIIEAIQFTEENRQQVRSFVSSSAEETENGFIIHTLEGDMLASPNDYIIKGIRGEFYPCKPDIFIDTYDECEEE